MCENVSSYIKQNTNSIGTVVNVKEPKYANDTIKVLHVDGSRSSLFAALTTVNFFSTFPELKINKSSTKIVLNCLKTHTKRKPSCKMDTSMGKYNILYFGKIMFCGFKKKVNQT